jgi:hypothetical protein
MNQTTPQAAAAPAPVLFDPFGIEEVTTGTLRVRNDITGALTTWVITLAGPEHPDRKRRQVAQQRRMRAAFFKSGGKPPSIDPEDEEADLLDELVASTLGWEGIADAYTPQKAREFYSDRRLAWLRRQVKEALEERERFMRASAPT